MNAVMDPTWKKPLDRANEIRVQRARIARQIRDGAVLAEEIIGDPPPEMRTAKVAYLLRAVTGLAEGRVPLICQRAGVSEKTRLCDLKVRERLALIDSLRRPFPNKPRRG